MNNLNSVMSSSVKICTFNCRSVKNSMGEVKQLCDKHDLILLQEHWLLPNELQLLSGIHTDYLATGASAVDIGSDVLVGRPYGGTAILYKRILANRISVVQTGDSRLTGIKINTRYGPTLILSVYMPTDYHDDDSLEKYVEICGKINALIIDSDIVECIIAGDFNCSLGSRFYCNFDHLMSENKLTCSDINMLPSAFTYSSNDHSCTSWIDHILCTKSMNDIIAEVKVLYDHISSDHKPLSISFANLLESVDCNISKTDTVVSTQRCWNAVDDLTKLYYSTYLDQLLQSVPVPSDLQLCLCTSNSCAECNHHQSIIDYYNQIMWCVESAVNVFVPVKNTVDSTYNVPGWNEYVQDKHTEARSAYLSWLQSGKPRSGYLFQLMQRTRANFKLALRYCRQQEVQLRADACAINLRNKDPIKFWQSVKKASNRNATKYASTIGNVTGEQNISEMWRTHFQQLYNSVSCDNDLISFNNFLSGVTCEKINVCVADVARAVSKQKLSKSTGPDGIHSEAYMNGGLRLATHLCIVFNLFLTHGFIPENFMSSIIVPLVKCKSGDLTDINNYRAITLSNAITKILEAVLLEHVNDKISRVDSQFGFKAGHSTSLCTFSFKQVVDYYTGRGSHVFVCFADFRKAFDRVNYWKLFKQLIDIGLSTQIVSLLAYWYSHQHVCVRWRNALSSSFTVGNGTKQGGILSPCLFNCYLRDLIIAILSTKVGCNIGGLFVNILAYADDVVLLAPSWSALQLLINMLADCALTIDMLCNTDKTVCMIFPPKDKRKVVTSVFPCFKMNNLDLKYVDEFKYLGHIISNNERDDNDVLREVRAMFTRTNILARRFSSCSVSVKTVLFRSYCICFYGMELWKCYNLSTVNRLRSCYIKCMKLFFKYSKYYSVTDMLTELRLPSFDTLIYNSRLNIARQVQSSHNSIIAQLCAILCHY